MTYLLALDQGTSSSRSIVFDEHGHIVALAQQELPQIYPKPGWVEHDLMEIWRTQLATAREVLAKANIKAGDIRALEPQDRPAGPPRHCLAGQARRSHLRRPARAGQGKPDPVQDRPADRRLFLRHQAQMAARQRTRRARTGRAR